jgi:small subunit ribosomal protein S7
MEQKKINRFESFTQEYITSKFQNKITVKGKKLKAEYIFYKALNNVRMKNNLTSSKVILTILNRSCPVIEVKSIRVGGIVRQIPSPVKLNRQLILGIRWIVISARQRSNRTFISKLTSEFNSILKSEGPTMNKQIKLHKLAGTNKGLLHFRWY